MGCGGPGDSGVQPALRKRQSVPVPNGPYTVYTSMSVDAVKHVLNASRHLRANVLPADGSDRRSSGIVLGTVNWIRNASCPSEDVRSWAADAIANVWTIVGLPEQDEAFERALALARQIDGLVFDGTVLMRGDGAVVASHSEE